MKVFARILIISVLFPFIGIGQSSLFKTISPILKNQILSNAKMAMTEKPTTVTAQQCERSAGGLHDFYSEGDYWWPDPAKPDGLPYIRRDGESNPGNFSQHRMAVKAVRDSVAALAAAYKITGDDRYAVKAAELLRVFWSVLVEE